MMTLKDTTDLLRVITSAAGAIDCVVDYITMTNASPPVMDPPDVEPTASITTATTTTIAAAAGSNKRKICKMVTIRNTHASVSNDITVIFERSGTPYQRKKVTLAPGEELLYIEGLGWFEYEAPLSALSRRIVLGSDVINTGVTPAAITGLSALTGLGTFVFKYMARYQAAATGTGVGFSVNHTGTLAFFLANQLYVDNLATASSGAADQDAIAATAQVYGAYSYRAKSTAAAALTASVDTAAADMLMVIDGLMQVTADGNIELWHRSEVAANSTVKSGSALILDKVG